MRLRDGLHRSSPDTTNLARHEIILYALSCTTLAVRSVYANYGMAFSAALIM